MNSPETIRTLLSKLYPDAVDTVYEQIRGLLAKANVPAAPPGDYFSERNITLITYGDSLRRAGETPLNTLGDFLNERLHGVISTVHILPFYPYSSDDGFSVIDYHAVNPELGSWADIQGISRDYRMMFDAVINHMSAGSAWFKGFLADEPDYAGLFFTESPDTDLSAVTRPRTSPLLTAFQRVNGETVHVWTTFSADQIDLDYRAPGTLLRVLDVLLFYIEQGASVIRLDAIAFMWKRAGTTSLHLPETHAVIQLLRACLNVVAPHVVLITETNVPHAENITYFGDGTNEAQLVYNFTLPPLLLHTLISGDARKLVAWANTLQTPSDQTAFFNFTASHDGIGVRPVEGILAPDEVAAMIAHVEANGGRVSYKANPDGSRAPYEMNITYVDAVAGIDANEAQHIARFLLSQAVMLSMAGIPAVYIHSLLGSHNDQSGVERLGYPRAINRAKLDVDTVRAELGQASSFRAKVFAGYSHLIKTRMAQPAFHPLGKQRAFAQNDGKIFGLERVAPDRSQSIIALFNMTDSAQTVQVDADGQLSDALSGETFSPGTIPFAPYQIRWLASL
jgi:glucosylglycerate phosphorylase